MKDRIDLKEAQRLFRIKARYQRNYDQLKTNRAIEIIEGDTNRIIKGYITSACMIAMGSWITSVAILSLF